MMKFSTKIMETFLLVVMGNYTRWEKVRGCSMILVTGASGTLGKEISRQLAQRKLDFRCLVRKTSKVENEIYSSTTY